MAGKRANQEGSIYFDEPRGLWTAAITVDAKRVYKRSKRQDVVKRWFIENRAKAQNGTLPSNARNMTVAQLLDQWLEDRIARLRPRTVKSYETIIRLHLKPGLGKHKVSELRPMQIQDVYRKKLSDGDSRRLVQLCHVVLHCALEYALEHDMVARNVSDATTPPRPEYRHRVHAWDLPEARRFLNMLEVSGDRLWALYTLAITTGLRRGELLGLYWSDIDIDRRTLQVRRQLQRVTGQQLLEGEPKTAKGRRLIILCPQAISALQAWKVSQQEERMSYGGEWQVTPYTFTNTRGGALEPRNVSRHFQNKVQEYSLTKIRFHDLRHTCATLLLEAGQNAKVVQEMLGHATISLTLDTYSHVLPSMQEEAAAVMGRLIAGS